MRGAGEESEAVFGRQYTSETADVHDRNIWNAFREAGICESGRFLYCESEPCGQYECPGDMSGYREKYLFAAGGIPAFAGTVF